MNTRERFLRTFSSNPVRPPCLESDFAPDAIAAWRAAGSINGATPEAVFQLDPRENMPVNWSRLGNRRRLAEDEAGLAAFRAAYDPSDPGRLPADWPARVEDWRRRDRVLRISPWDEGLLQIIGITEFASFERAIMMFFERPERIEAMMDHYADFLVALLDRILPEVRPDYAVLYECIASNRMLVIPPHWFERFAMPAMRRVIACLERHGVGLRFIWTTGAVRPLIPIWLEAGVNGLLVTQTAASGIDYLELRREFGPGLRLMGGLDWEEVRKGPREIDALLRRTAVPLLEQGGAIPHLDDRIRIYLPFENYQYFRQQLNRLIAEVHK